jgi:hypothetical protein
VAPKLFLKNFELPFLEKYQHLYKASLDQSLPFVGFYHKLKYLHNLQSHSVHTRVPELRKSSITGLLLKISTFPFFYASTAHSENIAVYIQDVPIL